jgi:hypothetical protein
MKKIFIITLTVMFALTSCQKQDFEESYSDPSKISESSLEKQFTGILVANREYVIPSYWNYFVVLRPTVNRYIKTNS